MFDTADVEVHAAPVGVRLAAHQLPVVVRVHVAQIVGRRTGETRHGARLIRIPFGRMPPLGTGERRFSGARRTELRHIGQRKRQRILRQRTGRIVLIINREGLSPITLTAEDGVAQAVIDLLPANAPRLYLREHPLDGLLHVQAVEEPGIHHPPLLRIVTCDVDIAPLDHRHDAESEMFGESVVARVVRWYGHDGSRTVPRQHVVADINRQFRAGERINRIRTGENAADPFGIGHPFALGTPLRLFDIALDLRPLCVGRQCAHLFMFRRDDHERASENGIGPCGEYLQFPPAAPDAEEHLRSGAAPYPVALYLLERFAPVKPLHAVEQPFGIGAHPQQPLLHALLHYRETAPHRKTVHHLVVGKHRTEPFAPVHRRVGPVSQPVVQQHLLSPFPVHRIPFGGGELHPLGTSDMQPLRSPEGERLGQFGDGARLLPVVTVIAVEHLQERPLRPPVICGVAGHHLPVPVVRESELVELFPVTRHVLRRGDRGMLPRLDGILLGRKPESIEPHRMQHVEPAEPFIARIDVRSDIPQRMPDVEARPGRIRKHVEHIILGAGSVRIHPVSPAPLPLLLPARLYFAEIVLHKFVTVFLSCIRKDRKYIIEI